MPISAQALHHMKSPIGCGRIASANKVGRCGHESSGPFLILFLKLSNSVIEDCSYQTYMCPWAIASGSVLVSLIKGRTLKDAAEVSEATIESELGGVPRNKRYCLGLSLEALRDALKD
jgi:nitrogen fixation protein NifU and related proteins